MLSETKRAKDEKIVSVTQRAGRKHEFQILKYYWILKYEMMNYQNVTNLKQNLVYFLVNTLPIS